MAHKTATGVYTKEQRAHRDSERRTTQAAAVKAMDTKNAPAKKVHQPGQGASNYEGVGATVPERQLAPPTFVDKQVEANTAGYGTVQEHEDAQREMTGKKNRPEVSAQ